MYYDDTAGTLPPFYSPFLLFSTRDPNIDFPKLTYGDLKKKKSALGKGPTSRKSNCNAEYPIPWPIGTASLELLNPLHLYPAFKDWDSIYISLHATLYCSWAHFSTPSDFLGSGPIFWECLNPTTGICTRTALIPVCRWCHRNYHNESRHSSCFKYLFVDKA